MAAETNQRFFLKPSTANIRKTLAEAISITSVRSEAKCPDRIATRDFRHLSNIAQRQRVRREIVLPWGFRIEPQSKLNSSRAILIFSMKVQGEGTTSAATIKGRVCIRSGGTNCDLRCRTASPDGVWHHFRDSRTGVECLQRNPVRCPAAGRPALAPSGTRHILDWHA